MALFAVGPFLAAGGNAMSDLKAKGVIGGAQVGYNWIYTRNVVLGSKADTKCPEGPKAKSDQST